MGLTAGLGDGAAVERADVPICSLSGSLPAEAGRLLAALDSAHGVSRGAAGCAAERLQRWTPQGASGRVTGALRGDPQRRELRKGGHRNLPSPAHGNLTQTAP